MASNLYGSDHIVDLLKLYGIEYAALNPGSSFRGLHDSIVNYADNRPEIIECPHEKIAVGVAHGYARATGKPMAAILHNLVGLLQGTMGIYYAYVDEAPVLVLGASGPMDTSRRRPYIDWIHTAQNQGDVVRDYTKWDDQPHNIDSVADSFARAHRVATTQPQGPVYLCYDVSLQEDPLAKAIPLPDPKRLAAAEPSALSPHNAEKVAEMLMSAKRPVVTADLMGRNPKAVDKLIELADLIAVPVVDLGRRLNFPSGHPMNLTGSNALTEADLILAFDVKDLYGPLTKLDRTTRETISAIKVDCKIIDIGLRDVNIKAWSQQFQKLPEVDLSLTADSEQALAQLIEACKGSMSKAMEGKIVARREQFTEVHSGLHQRWQEESRTDWDLKPMTTARLAWEVGQAIQSEDWVHTGSDLRGWVKRLWDFKRPEQFPGTALGTATQIGLALGVALAYRGTDKLVVDIQPDGDLMFDASALWVATHHKIPMLVVMYNNRAYYNDWEHQVLMARERGREEENAFLGMEIANPAPDFSKLAQSFGWYAEGPIDDPNEVGPAIQRAIKVIKETGQPALVDAITQPR
jgi:acetolactate synthase-1/2/3 large subunit